MTRLVSVVFNQKKLKITLFVDLDKKESFDVAYAYAHSGMREMLYIYKEHLGIEKIEIKLNFKHHGMEFDDRIITLGVDTLSSREEYETILCDAFVDFDRDIRLELHMRGLSLSPQ